jgi:hypothetical protein
MFCAFAMSNSIDNHRAEFASVTEPMVMDISKDDKMAINRTLRGWPTGFSSIGIWSK